MDFIARRKGSAALLCLVVVSANDAAAQDSAGRMPWQEYNERIRATELVAPLTSEIFGEQISLYDGSTEFAVTDVSIPGNSGLPVELRRRFKVESKKEMEFFGGFGEWDLDVPYLFGVFTAAWKWNEGATERQVVALNRGTRGREPSTIWTKSGPETMPMCLGKATK